MTITGMTLKLSEGQRDRLREQHADRGGSLDHSFLQASNYPHDESPGQNAYPPAQVDYGNQYFNPSNTQGTFIPPFDQIDEEPTSHSKGAQEMQPDPTGKVRYLQSYRY